MKTLFTFLFLSTLLSCFMNEQNEILLTNIENHSMYQDTLKKVIKSEKHWEDQLTPLQFNILRKKGTEKAFSGEYWNNKKKGKYCCRGCDLFLFKSETKFKSGSGWPSFYDKINNHVNEVIDNSFGNNRIEVVCNRCNGHLGHIFKDGPKPTGLRYCINSAALKFYSE